MVARSIDPNPRAAQRWPDVPMDARTRRRITIAVTLILVLAGSVMAARWVYTDHQAHEPVEAVRAFLEASRSGDVDAALALTMGELPGTEELLVPEAMNSDWEIADLGLQTWIAPDLMTRVWATILGPNDTELTTEFSLEKVDGDWKVEYPLTTLTVEELPLPYFEVNGVRLPAPSDTSAGHDFAVLPGVYQVYQNPPDLLAYEGAPLLALGRDLVSTNGTNAKIPGNFEGFTVAEGSEPELNERLMAYLDECMAGPDGPEQLGCPFGHDPSDIDIDGFNPADDHRWEIVEHPQAAAASVTGPAVIESQIQLLTRHEGLARVTVTDEDTGEEASLECPITTTGLYLTFDDNGGYAIGPNQDPNAPTSPTDTQWEGGYESWCEPT